MTECFGVKRYRDIMAREQKTGAGHLVARFNWIRNLPKKTKHWKKPGFLCNRFNQVHKNRNTAEALGSR